MDQKKKILQDKKRYKELEIKLNWPETTLTSLEYLGNSSKAVPVVPLSNLRLSSNATLVQKRYGGLLSYMRS